MKTWRNMIQPKKQNTAPGTDPKEMKVFKLSDKELKVIIMRKTVSSGKHCVNQIRISENTQEE